MDHTLLIPEAERHLAGCDPRLQALIAQVGRCTLAPEPDIFRVLVRTIVSQLISTKAAQTIQARVDATVKGKLTPGKLRTVPVETLRSCGLSNAKARSILAVAEHFHTRRGFVRTLAAADDLLAREHLLALPGVGPWTVDMVLMFSVPWRHDILPVGDLGIRAGMRDLFDLPDLPSPRIMEDLAAPWRPYRTVACWYLWRSRGWTGKAG